MRRLLVAAGLLAVLAAAAAWTYDRSEDTARAARFDERSAWSFLQRQVALGPRPAGSPESRELAGILRRSIPRGRFQAVPGELRNVVGTIPGRNPRRTVVLGAHYDTKDLPGFVGANDAASGTAVVRELARTIKPRQLRPTLIVVFFDGEEAPRGKDAQFERNGLRGSKVAARAFRSAEAAIVLDFVGDKELALPRERLSNRRLWGRLRAAARRTGFARHFPAREQGAVLDDHVPFIRAGVPAIDLIDFDFACWHRSCDDLSAVSPQSLNAVGETMVAFPGRSVSRRVLTQRELNRALLARQLLLERGRMSIPKGLERIGGIQAQYAPAMYVGLWSRVAGLERAALTRALEHRSVIQATLMRATIHLVSRPDYWPLTAAIRAERRTWWERTHKQADPKRARAESRQLRAFLAGRPRRWKEIQERFGREDALAAMQYVDLVRVPPSGTWEQRRADLYGLAEEWTGPGEAEQDEGIELLVRRYLGGFGPASPADAADFGMVSIARVRAVLERMQLRRFRDENGKELVDLPRAPLPDSETAAPPRFLPVWDATLLVHARRTQILPEAYRPLVFNVKLPHSVNTFLLDGQVAGSWRFEDGKVLLDAFDGIPRAQKRALDEEAARLAAFHR